MLARSLPVFSMGVCAKKAPTPAPGQWAALAALVQTITLDNVGTSFAAVQGLRINSRAVVRHSVLRPLVPSLYCGRDNFAASNKSSKSSLALHLKET